MKYTAQEIRKPYSHGYPFWKYNLPLVAIFVLIYIISIVVIGDRMRNWMSSVKVYEESEVLDSQYMMNSLHR